jgi:hypothetical protein
MAVSRGFQGIAGVAKESTLGTAAAATAKLPLISETFSASNAHIQNAALVGAAARKRAIKGARSVPGAVTAYLTYDLQHPVLERFCGTFVDDVGGDYYRMDDTTDGKGLTLAIDKQVSVHEFAGVKFSELVLSGSPADAVRVTATGMGTARSLTSVTNTAVTLAALDEPGDEIQYHELTLRIGDLANALASGDDVDVENFSLRINRQLIQKQVNSLTLLEARENGFQEGNLTIQLPLYDSNQFLTWHDTHTTLQATLTFTDGTSTKEVRLPQLLVVHALPQLSGPELVGYSVELSVHANADGANSQTGFDFPEAVRVFES